MIEVARQRWSGSADVGDRGRECGRTRRLEERRRHHADRERARRGGVRRQVASVGEALCADVSDNVAASGNPCLGEQLPLRDGHRKRLTGGAAHKRPRDARGIEVGLVRWHNIEREGAMLVEGRVDGRNEAVKAKRRDGSCGCDVHEDCSDCHVGVNR